MLTPASDDPNREDQLKKKKEDPAKFGASHEQALKEKKEAAAKSKTK